MVKKVIISILLIVVSFTCVEAQIINIDSFTDVSTDYTESIKPRYDANDLLCSVLIVQGKNIDGAIDFKGNIVGDIINEQDSYVIYVANKTKRLTIYHEDYFPQTIDFTLYPDCLSGLKSGSIYNLCISGYYQQMSIGTSSGSRILKFSSKQPLSQILVNGEEWDVVDSKTAKKMLPCGKYEYEVVSLDKIHKKGSVELTPSIGSKVVNIDFDVE